MIRIVIGGIIMVLIITVSLFSFFVSQDYTELIIKTLDEATESFNSSDFVNAAETSQRAVELWNEYRSHILFAGNFEQEKDVTETLAEIETHAEYGEDEFYSKINSATSLVQTFFQAQIPYLHNIL